MIVIMISTLIKDYLGNLRYYVLLYGFINLPEPENVLLRLPTRTGNSHRNRNVLFFRADRSAVKPVCIGQFVIDYFIWREKQLDFLLSRFRAVRAVNEIASFRTAKVPSDST